MAYSYLPGFDVSVRDGGLVVPRQEFQTGSLLIIGPRKESKTGAQPNGDPIWIQGQEDFEKAFGKIVVDEPLFRRWKQATDAGCKDVRILELYGTSKEEQYKNLHTIYSLLGDYVVDAVVLVGVYADDEVPDTVEIDDNAGETFDYCSLVPNVLKDLEEEHVTSEDSETEFSLNGVIVEDSVIVKVGEVNITDFTVDYVNGKVTLDSLPEEGTTITISYRHAERSFAAQLAGYCLMVSKRVSQTVGFIGLIEAINTDLSSVRAYVRDQKVQLYDGLVSIVGGSKIYFVNNDGTTYKDSGVVAYAAQSIMLPPKSAPTNKILPGAAALEYNLSPAQLDDLCSKNIVSFRSKANRIVVTDAITSAGRNSDFTRLSTVRIVNDAIQAIRDVADPFIGEPNDLPQQNALKTAINSALDAMVKDGALRGFQFNLSASMQDYIDGTMKIDVELVPAFELRKIKTTVSLKPSL